MPSAPRSRARWGGGPRGTLLHQAAWLGRPDAGGAAAGARRRRRTPGSRPSTRRRSGWAAVGSRYSPDHPDDSFSAPDADYVGVATLLVAAGARIEAKFVEMATAPLTDWLAEAGGGERR